MENFLPALLIIGGIIYKIYTEFQKEQEKARQRRPSAQPTAQPSVPTPPAVPLPEARRRQSVPPTIPQQESGKSKKGFSTYQGVVPEEVEKVRRGQQKDQNIDELKVEDIDEKDQVDVDFNLREAVIQSAILNRPYRD